MRAAPVVVWEACVTHWTVQLVDDDVAGDLTPAAGGMALDDLPLAVMVADGEGRVMAGNEAFEAMFGGSVPDGRRALEALLTATGVAAAAERLAASFSQPADLVLRIGGAERPVRLLSRTNAQGGAVHLLHDLRTDAEEQARRAQMQSLIAHDLRSPLAVIQGYAGLLATGKPGPLNATQCEFLAGIDAKIAEVTRLMDDFLDLSRLDAGAMRLDLQAVDLADLLRSVVDEAVPRADGRGITVDLVGGDGPAPIAADPLRMRQVFGNLVGNAVKYNHDGGWVRCEVARRGADWKVVVADGGPGLSGADMTQLFEPYARGDAGRGTSGTGLGLVIVKRLVELHGGAIAVCSKPGEGTVFTVTLQAGSPPIRG